MKTSVKYILMLVMCLWVFNSYSLLQTNYTSGTWYDVAPSLDSAARFEDLSFLNRDIGFVGGRIWNMQSNLFLVIHSTNGGVSWDTTDYKKSVYCKFVSFYDSKNGVSGSANIYVTSNGGETWNLVLMAAPIGFGYGKMVSEKLIYVSGIYGKIIKSTDAGLTWEYIQPEFIKEYPTKLSVIDSNKIYALAEEQLIYTSDGGDSWIEVGIPRPPGVTYNYLDFINVNYGWIVGSSRHIYKTTDGGQSWINQSPPQAGDGFTCIDALDSKTAIAGTSRAAILRTDNGGNRWIEQLSGKYNAIIDRVQIIDKEVAYAVGYDGILLKTTDGGTTFVNHENPIPSAYSLSQNYPNPFNSQTTIKFSLPQAEFVQISLFNSNGEKIKTLVNETKSAGKYSIILNADNFSSGVYLVNMNTGRFNNTIKIIHVK